MDKEKVNVEVLDIEINLSNYQELAIRTNKELHSVLNNSVHYALGVVGEYGELLKAIKNNDSVNIREEIGDMTWYIANECQNYGFSFETLMNKAIYTHLEEDDKYDVFGYVDYVKKYYAYDLVNQADEIEKYLVNILRFVYNEVYWRDEYFSIHSTIERNIKKLLGRFGGAYSNYKALNRDLDNEAKILE